ncbi:peptidase M14 [Parashewanella spongiae]|uniref:Peptidase M14 n=1 Tax=Parashewanella spongiae TaxID=342950 RepID=A0A3A6U5L6_9GAMM|nr:M14 family zinc carboxypeptidase [Parashewanella spongiae]MCL1077171.1 peptidase M14 [Parashewanella spongiae]RJY19327.1 peptidase M14 [Parashewanella spongiae]
MTKLPLLSFIVGTMITSSLSTTVSATIQTQFQLPQGVEYQKAITTPDEFLGYPMGKWHLRHDQLNFYIKNLAEQSPRVALEHSGKSHEDRQQLSLLITSESNHNNIDSILAQRAAVKHGESSKGPLVVWLAYSIHGDEASGVHAAMELSYYLSASNESWVKSLLEETVVIITPSQNPDGMDRFATWANNNRSNTFNADPNNREHHQHWARGRLNHYLADLNRDWLFLRHPESQGRVALFHKWQPHYVGDFHEMGHRSSYFFQPGVPSRTHPLTPQKNQQLTDKIANYHRAALDKVGQPYYSKQSFDDFFYGKGSTYPDINGAIGVLFEQASARGQAQDSPNGVVTLTRAIQNQFATSISSLKGTLALKDELHQYQNDFFKDKQSDSKRQQGVLISTHTDIQRRDEFASLLNQHQIRSHYLTKNVNKADVNFTPNDSLFIPLEQPQSDLITALFDKRTEFEDETFYDVSSFDLAAAFDLTVSEKVSLKAPQFTKNNPTKTSNTIGSNSVAVLLDWQQSASAKVLQQLLANDVIVKYSQKPFSVKHQNTTQNFGAGSLQIHLRQDNISREQLITMLESLSSEHQLKSTAVDTFASVTGGDLGSPDFKAIQLVKPLLITGDGSNPMEVGQIWHYLDNTLKMPVTLTKGSRLKRLKLSDYSHVLFAHGNYNSLDKTTAIALKAFVKQGGTIVAHKGALRWLKKHELLSSELFDSKQAQALFNTNALTFGDQSALRAKQTIGGAIVNVELDLTHPLNYGLSRPQLKIMKNSILALVAEKPFTVSGQYAKQPLSSGFMAQEYQSVYPQKSAVVAESLGRGQVIGFADNLLFRNIWLGSERIYANALFFAPNSL